MCLARGLGLDGVKPRAAISGQAKHSVNVLFLLYHTIPLYPPCRSQSCRPFLASERRPNTDNGISSTLRPPPNIDFVQGASDFPDF